VSLALKEWHVAAEAIAAGRQVITIRKGGIREKEFSVRGARFWLFPTWEHESADQVKPAWHDALRRSQAARLADGSVPVRCRCTVVEAWELTEPEPLERLDPLHLWTPGYVEERLRWRPRKPLLVLLLRAEQLAAPLHLPPSDAYGGCRSWLELERVPEAALLAPALTAEAFGEASARVRAALGAASAAPAASSATA
jgi:hypothetical protein